MWSRRKFIFSMLAGSALWIDHSHAFAFRKRVRHIAAPVGPQLLMSEYWPPAIACNFIDTFDGSLCCQADDFSRLATANVLSADPKTHTYPILGEIITPGSKILYLKVLQSQLALVIVKNKEIENEHNSSSSFLSKNKKSTEGSATQGAKFACVLVNLASAESPEIVSNTGLPAYSQLTAFATNTIKNRPIICIAGIDFDEKNRVSFYGFKNKGKLHLISSFVLSNPVKKLSFGDQTLLVLQDTTDCQVSVIDVSNLNNPHFLRTVKLPGSITEMASYGNVHTWSTSQDSDCTISVGDIRAFPQAYSKQKLDASFSIDSLAINNKYILALGNNDEENVVMPIVIDKNYTLYKQKPVSLTGYMEASVTPSKIIFGKDCAFISSGWAGVQVLKVDHSGKWSASTCFTQQKLPIAGCVAWSNYLLMAAGDLRLYDINNPKQAKLLSTIELPATIKMVAAAGSYVLCLDKSGLSLRKIDNPKKVLATLKINAEKLSFDKENHKAYLIQSEKQPATKKKTGNTTKLVELNVYNDSIEIAKTFSIIEDSYCSSADEGHVVIGNLDGLAIYKPEEENKLVCQRPLKDLAWREIILSKGNIFATAIDQNVNGFFLTMSFDGQDINVLSTTKIPHDVVAVRISNNIAYTVGQDSEGRSLLTTIDISNMTKPVIISSKPAIESASTIAVDKNLAIVAGQGFQIFAE